MWRLLSNTNELSTRSRAWSGPPRASNCPALPGKWSVFCLCWFFLRPPWRFKVRDSCPNLQTREKAGGVFRRRHLLFRRYVSEKPIGFPVYIPIPFLRGPTCPQSLASLGSQKVSQKKQAHTRGCGRIQFAPLSHGENARLVGIYVGESSQGIVGAGYRPAKVCLKSAFLWRLLCFFKGTPRYIKKHNNNNNNNKTPSWYPRNKSRTSRNPMSGQRL